MLQEEKSVHLGTALAPLSVVLVAPLRGHFQPFDMCWNKKLKICILQFCIVSACEVVKKLYRVCRHKTSTLVLNQRVFKTLKSGKAVNCAGFPFVSFTVFYFSMFFQ